MAHTSTNPDPIATVRPYLDGVAKSLVDRLFGPDGPAWGTSLSSLEETIDSIRQTLSESMLGMALDRQSDSCSRQALDPTGQSPPQFPLCPGCQQSTMPRDPEPRIVTTAVGIAEWSEPHYFCPKCRKSFFPSVQESGTRSGRG